MIEFRKVSKRFGGKIVLDQMDLTFNDGEIIFIIGKSGMGKSVLLKHIVGLLRPDAGEIWIDGLEATRLKEEDYYPVRKKCGMVFQFPALLDSLTVFENIAFGVRAHRLVTTEAEVASLVEEKLSLVNLGKQYLSSYPTELSYGMQKRVSIARTLAVSPSYLLFDEPTTGLDPVTTSFINDLIQRLSRKLSVTSVVVSHDMHCALAIADKIYLLNRGKVVAAGTPDEMRASTSLLAQDFLKEAKEREADATPA